MTLTDLFKCNKAPLERPEARRVTEQTFSQEFQSISLVYSSDVSLPSPNFLHSCENSLRAAISALTCPSVVAVSFLPPPPPPPPFTSLYLPDVSRFIWCCLVTTGGVCDPHLLFSQSLVRGRIPPNADTLTQWLPLFSKWTEQNTVLLSCSLPCYYYASPSANSRGIWNQPR